MNAATLGEGPAQQMTKASWQRPPPPALDQTKDRLVFQQVFILPVSFYVNPSGGAGPLHWATRVRDAWSQRWASSCGQDVRCHQVSSTLQRIIPIIMNNEQKIDV